MNIKVNPKRLFYIFICVASLFVGLIFLLTIKANNRKFNPSLLKNIEQMYNTTLRNNTLYNEAIYPSNYTLPYKLKPFIESQGQRCIYLDSNEFLGVNTECLSNKDIDDIANIITRMMYYDAVNITSKDIEPTFVPIKVDIYKHINIILLTQVDKEEESRVEDYINNNLKNIELGLSVNIRYLYYNSDFLNDGDLYKDIKTYNSKYLIEELKDDEIINIVIYQNDKTEGVDVYYNKDIKQDIFSSNVMNGSFIKNLQKIILLRITNPQIKARLSSSRYQMDLLSLIHSKSFKYHKMLLESLDNLETFNKFVLNYASVKTFEAVKEKVSILVTLDESDK
jgi:hypothetical protein